MRYYLFLLTFVSSVLIGCNNKLNQEHIWGKNVKLSDEFKEYWYSGEAELTSYELEQARYGNMNQGTSVLIFVTEPFNTTKQVKADHTGENEVSVMKLNFSKKFITGIYPYSMMTSSFMPVNNTEPIKITASSQEWCGHTFTQLNNSEGQFKVNYYSYFESESDSTLVLGKALLEDAIWNTIRLDPESLPEGGALKMIPSFLYIRLMHKEMKSYDVVASIERTDSTVVYELNYPKLNRTLAISYNPQFPYTIEGWIETYTSGWGDNAKELTTRAKKITTITSPYWQHHNPEDSVLRIKLGLQ